MTGIFRRGTTAKLCLSTLIVGVLASPLLVGFRPVADQSVSLAALDNNLHVILMRHGDAPGRNEPVGFNLDDCSTQRNLSDKGRNEARELGEMFRGRGINITKVLTSRWCRARETAELLKLGAVENAPAFDNLEINKQRAAELLDREREQIASWRGPGVLLIVTHGSNIKALTGLDLEQGAMIVTNPIGRSSTSLRFDKFLLQNKSS
jgi:phosphohistidine phosphatase SixA